MGKGNRSIKPTRHSTRKPQPTKDYQKYKEDIQQRKMKKENGNLVSMFKGLSVRPNVHPYSKRHTMKDLTKSFSDFKFKINGGNKTKRRNNKRSRRSLKKR